MAIEVRELIIKARVEETSSGNTGGNSAQSSMNEKEIQKIIALCAEEVLKVLKRQKER
jgi:hypothetical protein